MDRAEYAARSDPAKNPQFRRDWGDQGMTGALAAPPLPAPPPLFDYGGLPADLAAKTRFAAEQIHILVGRGTRIYLEIGLALLRVKKALDHGRFRKWIAAEFGMSDKTAENYMNAASSFEGKFETVSNLKPTTLYALAAAPTKIKGEILSLLEDRQPIPDAWIKETATTAARREREAAAERARLDAEAKRTPEEKKRLADKAKRQRRTREQREGEEREWRAERDRRERARDALIEFLVRSIADHSRLLELVRDAGQHLDIGKLTSRIRSAQLNSPRSAAA